MVSKSSLLLTVVAALAYTTQVHSQLVVSQFLVAHFDGSQGVVADFQFSSLQSGPGAQVDIDVKSGLNAQVAVYPKAGFEYHIHVNPVGPNHDCMATGGHLDPLNVGTTFKCTTKTPADKCQEGDLSGKHGNITATADGKSKKISYIDHQLQFSGATTTIVGRSVVIHNNGARMACADIVSPGSGDADKSSDGDNPSATAESAQKAQAQSNSAQGGRWIGREKATTALAVVATGVMGLLSAL
ncbi:hypothetical protein EMPS_09474 [Entomortierella parvispora]|uniref:Superoxide dismutase copper/zinc binding domain-containing protein n=1 Tax=Entomortierella parvispora TaxID=205924 RepID=A0A9P3HI42_9FUNG|nr:hypothetical protein EMPS_09474 [Entomortierella parvispora]